MWKGRYILEQMKEQTANAAQPVLPQTIVEVAGYRRVLIENHRGVTTYDREKIVVKVQYGSLAVCGRELEILHMTKEQLVIFGTVCSISVLRRERT